MCSDCAHKFDWMVGGEWNRCAMHPDRSLIRARAECLGKSFEAKAEEAETLTAVSPEAALAEAAPLIREAGRMLAALDHRPIVGQFSTAESFIIAYEAWCDDVRVIIAKARGEG
jgi:hypothetical protein